MPIMNGKILNSLEKYHWASLRAAISSQAITESTACRRVNSSALIHMLRLLHRKMKCSTLNMVSTRNLTKDGLQG